MILRIVCILSRATSTDTTTTTTTTVTPVSSSLTISSDTVTGTTGADTVSGARVDSIQTLNSGDNIDLGAGADTLSATLNAGTIAPTIANVETLTFSATAAATVDFDNATGYTTLVNTGSTNTLTLDDIATVAGIKVANTASSTTVVFKSAALSGTADAVTLTLEDVTTGGTLTIGSEADADGAIETLNIVSSGVANTTTLAGGTTATSVTVTGAGDLDIDASDLFAALTSFDASAATGDVKVAFADKTTTSSTLDVSITTGSGADLVDIDQIANLDVDNVTVSLGAGDDTLVVSDQDTDTGSSFDGGDGVDTIRVDAPITSTAFEGNLSNFEVLQMAITGTDTQDMDLTGGINTVSVFSANAVTDDLDINDAVSGIVVRMDGTAVADGHASTDDFGNITVDLKTDGATDSMTLELSATLAGEELQIDLFSPSTSFETVTIVSGGAGSNTIDTIGTSKSNMIVTGARPLTFTTTGSLTGVLDATAMTGALTVTDTKDDVAIVINSGSGADSITLDDDQTAAVTVRTGDGDDTVNGGTINNDGSMLLTVDLGAGNDTLDFSGVDGSDTGTDTNTITTEITGGAGVDIITLGDSGAADAILNDINSSAETSGDIDHITGFITTADDFDYGGTLLNDAATTVTVSAQGTLAAALAADADATVYGATNNLTGSASTELTALANATTVEGINTEAADFEAALAGALGTVAGLDSTLGAGEAVLLVVDNATDSAIVRITNTDTSVANTLTAAEIEVIAVFEDEVVVAADVI